MQSQEEYQEQQDKKSDKIKALEAKFEHFEHPLKKKLLIGLELSFGNISEATKYANCARGSFYNHYNSDAEFAQAANDISESLIDFAESKLLQNVNLGDNTAIIFFLKSKGKSRGYVERHEVAQTDKSGNDVMDISKLSKEQLNAWLAIQNTLKGE